MNKLLPAPPLLALALALSAAFAACAPSMGGGPVLYRAPGASILNTIAASCPSLRPSAFYNNYGAGIVSGNSVSCEAAPNALVRNTSSSDAQRNSGFVPTPALLTFTITPQGGLSAVRGTLRADSETQSPESLNQMLAILDRQYARVR